MPTFGHLAIPGPPGQNGINGTNGSKAFTGSSAVSAANSADGDVWHQQVTGPLTASAGSGWTYTLQATYIRVSGVWTPVGLAKASLTGSSNSSGRATVNTTPINLQAGTLIVGGLVVVATTAASTASFADVVGLSTSSLDIQIFEGVAVAILGGFPLRAGTAVRTLYATLVGVVPSVVAP